MSERSYHGATSRSSFITVDVLPSVFIYDKTLPQKLTSTMMTQKVFYLRTAPSLGDSAELGHVANQTRCYLDSRFPERIRQWRVKYCTSYVSDKKICLLGEFCLWVGWGGGGVFFGGFLLLFFRGGGWL